MSSNPMRGVGPRIATARRARNLTQTELAAAAQISYSMLRAVERRIGLWALPAAAASCDPRWGR